MSDDDALSDALTNVKSFLQASSLNNCGPIGEIVGQLLFLLAHDAATSRSGQGLFSKAITLKQFLSVLVGDDQYLKTIEDNISTEMKEGLVCFTHFIKKLDELTYEDVIPNFVARGAAVQLTDDRDDGIDLVIPVVLKTGEIGYILIRLEHEVDPEDLVEVAKEIVPPSALFPNIQNQNSTHSSLDPNHFLGLVISIGESGEIRQNVELVKFKLKNEKICHNFILHGLNVTTFPFLNSKVQQTLKQLLGCDRNNLESMSEIYGADVLAQIAVGCANYRQLDQR
jgi:hypothetical protein